MLGIPRPARMLFGLPLALLLTACGQGPTGQPGTLHLRPQSRGQAAAATTGGYYTLGGGFILHGTLPAGPSTAPVFGWPSGSSVSGASVIRLAAAFGVTGTPVRHPYGWALSDVGGEVHVRDGAGAQWSYARFPAGGSAASGADCPVPSIDVDHASYDGVVASCGVAVGATSTTAPGPAPTRIPVDQPIVTADTAHAIADPILRTLGVKGPETVDPGPGTAYVQVDPTVNNLPTQGIPTLLQVDRADVTFSSGWLAPAVAGDTYPLVTAAQAFKDLVNRPVPMIAILCPQSTAASPTPCPSPTPTVITGAEIGLELNFDQDNGPLLVPSWFFRAADSRAPITTIAIDPAYLATPSPSGSAGVPSSDPGSGSGTSGGGSGSVGTPGPAVLPPGAPATGSAGPGGS